MAVKESLPLHVATYPIDYVYGHLKRYHGVARHLASNRLHRLKHENGLPPDFGPLFHKTGNVYRADDRSYLEA